MDANKVMEVLAQCGHYSAFGQDKNEIKICTYCAGFDKHYDDCELAALITAAEHEAQTGGWKPGTEPPSDDREVDLCFKMYGKMHRCVARFEHEPQFDFPQHFYMAGDRSRIFKVEIVVGWHDLPPLPEQAP